MANFFESIFEFLFKYRPVTWSRADFAWGAPYPTWLILVLAAAAVGFALITYRRVGARSDLRDRTVLTGLRVAAVLLLMVCLMRPMLVLSTALPQRNYVGVLIDDSQSMTIADEGKDPRSAVATQHFIDEKSKVLEELKKRFMVRHFAFSTTTSRVGKPDEMKFEGGQSRLMDALDKAEQDLSAVPVAGMIVVTDGADNSQSPFAEQLLKLKASGIPVSTIGIGQERFKNDVEIVRVEAPATALKGASVIVDLMLAQRGNAGDKRKVTVEDRGRTISEQEITLPADGETVPVRVHFTADDAGPRELKFKVATTSGELLTQNNEQDALVQVSDRREKILYFEGEPRFEPKFLLRALEEDENLQVVLLQRTAENKFLRRNVDDGDELAGGFPKTREELYKYRAVILGSVEASFFSHDQLQMLSDFVSDRGGSLLLLGGRHAFSEGGYFGTPLADALPIVFGPRRMSSQESEDDSHFEELNVSLTPAGRIHPATRLAPNETESAERWLKLPPVSSVNRIDEIKPGATELITGAAVRGRARQPILVFQRYGRGKVMAMPVQDVWMWQMHADISVEDETHEILWKQVSRWLVTGVPRPVNIAASNDRVAPNESVVLRANVTDKRYLPLNNAKVTSFATGPGMPEQEIPMEWTVDRDGEYRGNFTPKDSGQYRIRTVAYLGDTLLAVDTTYIKSATSKKEYFGSQMNKQLLQRIADETGGKFYTPDNLANLAEDMTYTKSGAVAVQQLDLWDMPFIFMILLGLVGSEWVYRKMRGLA